MFHMERSRKLNHASCQLRKLSDLYDVPIVITNQVTASFSLDPLVGERPMSSQKEVIPALGLAWSNCVNTRFILRRKEGMVVRISSEFGKQQSGSHGDEDGGGTTKNRKVEKQIVHGVRYARVLQSVNTPTQTEALFVIGTGSVMSMG